MLDARGQGQVNTRGQGGTVPLRLVLYHAALLQGLDASAHVQDAVQSVEVLPGRLKVAGDEGTGGQRGHYDHGTVCRGALSVSQRLLKLTQCLGEVALGCFADGRIRDDVMVGLGGEQKGG